MKLWFYNLYLRFKRKRDASNTYKQLSALSDRELLDIGLTRASIKDVALGLFKF